MNPASIDAMSWEMAEVYGAITDQIVINLAHYFPYLTAGKHPPKSMFDYQAAMLAQMGKINAQTMQIIRNNLSDADRALSASLETAIADAIKDSEPALYRGAKAGIFKPPTTPVLSANQTNAFRLYYKQAADKLNLVNTVMLESTQSAYMQTVSNVISEYEILERINRTQIALDVAAGETITGVSSWNNAVRHATQRMADGGITGFIDHAGRHWDAETYVAMDVRTTMFNSGRAAVWETNESFGNDLYIVSYHNGARPLCYDWQNKVISANNVSRDVADLDGNVVHVYAQNETTYGEPAGLFGINCKHYPTPFVPGVSVVRGQVQDKAENDKQYAESQKQRALERNLREQKRDLEMMKAQGADEDIIRAQREKVRAASKDIDDFCDETGRVRRRNREAVYTKRDFPSGNYDPSQFAREQQKRFDDFWKNGGTQSGFTFGQLVPNVPIPIKPQTPQTPPAAPVVPQTPTPTPAQNVASQATRAKTRTDTITSEKLDANSFPDAFNKKKVKTFVDTVNETQGTDPNVVKLFNKMSEQVNGAIYPVSVSYTEDGHAVQQWVRTFGGETVKLNVKIPKMIEPEFLRQEIGTTAHELGHLFDYLNAKTGVNTRVFSAQYDNFALPRALRNARPMSERVKNLIETAVKEGNAAKKLAMDAAKVEIDAISKEVSDAISGKNYSKANELIKKRNKLWNTAAKSAGKASRKAHDGRNAIEDIYDAISGGTLRDKTPGLYGHGSTYYGHDPGGENATTETLANYCSLALAYPELFELMAEEQPEIWEACGNIIKAMIGG